MKKKNSYVFNLLDDAIAYIKMRRALNYTLETDVIIFTA